MTTTHITSSSTDPTAVALTTVFTPATSCRGLTFSPPIYSIWYNEPVPAPLTTASDCYPSQWLKYYTSLSTSSIAPALNPLICPSGWTTALNSTSSYIACCPTGYAVHFPDTTVDSQRPAYGGLCFSGFTSGVTLTVVEYNATGIEQTQTVPFSSSGQVFAHVIDGYATKHVLSTLSTSLSPTGSSISNPTATADHSKGLSGGAIAGVVVGCVVGLVLLLALGLFFLRRRNTSRSLVEAGTKDSEAPVNESGSTPIYECDSAAAIAEKDGYPAAGKQTDGTKGPVELSSGDETDSRLERAPVLPAPVELSATPFRLSFTKDRDVI